MQIQTYKYIIFKNCLFMSFPIFPLSASTFCFTFVHMKSYVYPLISSMTPILKIRFYTGLSLQKFLSPCYELKCQ